MKFNSIAPKFSFSKLNNPVNNAVQLVADKAIERNYIESLPPEILVSIFKYLSSSDIRKVAQVSKQVKNITMFVYHSKENSSVSCEFNSLAGISFFAVNILEADDI